MLMLKRNGRPVRGKHCWLVNSGPKAIMMCGDPALITDAVAQRAIQHRPVLCTDRKHKGSVKAIRPSSRVTASSPRS